jgi:diadenylate cyclase
MPDTVRSLIPFEQLDVRSVADILLVAILVYCVLKPLRGLRAVQLGIAAVLLVALYQAARWAQLAMVEWTIATLAPYLALVIIILYQPEIRRALSRAGRALSLARPSEPAASALDDVVLAASYFSQNRIGALIAFERDISLHTYTESGIPLDANLSYDLLLAIFRPGSPLHDGAVIVQKARVAAAACFLPLSLNPMISNQLGTRHRAAIGVTEDSDAVVVLVSEQTGSISLAVGGAIEVGLTTEQLNDRLTTLFRRSRRAMGIPAFASGVRAPGKAD